MGKYSKVIFVSTEGTCRSVWAAAIFNSICSYDIAAESRGQVVLFEEPVNPKAVAIARSKGLSIENEMSKQLMDMDFGEDILVLVMTEDMKKKIYEEMPGAINVYTIREFTGETQEVTASYGGELVDYGENFEYIEKLVKLTIDIITKEL